MKKLTRKEFEASEDKALTYFASVRIDSGTWQTMERNKKDELIKAMIDGALREPFGKTDYKNHDITELKNTHWFMIPNYVKGQDLVFMSFEGEDK